MVVKTRSRYGSTVKTRIARRCSVGSFLKLKCGKSDRWMNNLARVLPPIFLGIALLHSAGRVRSQPIPGAIQASPLTPPAPASPAPTFPTQDFPFFSADIYSVLAGQDRLERETIGASLSSCRRIAEESRASGDRFSHTSEPFRSLPPITSQVAAEECKGIGSSQPVLAYDIFAPNGTRPEVAADYWQQFLALAQRKGDRLAKCNPSNISVCLTIL